MAVHEAAVTNAPASNMHLRRRWRDYRMELCAAGALLIVIAVFTALNPSVFLTGSNFATILQNTSVAGVLTAGLAVSLVAGQFDLSIGVTLALAGLVVAKLLNLGVPWWLAVSAAVLVGCMVGLVNGVVTVRGGVPSIMATLGMSSVITGVLIAATNGSYIEIIPQGFPKFGRSALLGVPTTAIVMIVLCVGGAIVMRYVTAGRNLQAAGRNPMAARLAGLNVSGLVMSALIVTGMFAAIAGVLLAATLSSGQPEVGPGYVLPAFAGAFLGAAAHRTGTFTFIGSLYGAFLLTTVTNGLVVANAASWISSVVAGLVLIGALLISRIARTRDQDRRAKADNPRSG